MIRPAKVREIPFILSITRRCAEALRARGIFQWDYQYPSKKAFLNDVATGSLWIFEQEGNIRGTVALTAEMDPEYDGVRWLTPNDNNRYVHRLAVDPSCWGKGMARKLMDFVEGQAREQGARSIRLDTFSRNLKNQRFYEARGYLRLGAVYFPAQSPYPFYCYEHILSSPA